MVDEETVVSRIPSVMRHLSRLAGKFQIAGLAVALLSALPIFSWADDIVTQIVAHCASQPRSYAQVTDALRQLATTSDRVSLAVIGYSHHNRPLWLVRVTDPQTPRAGKMRLFIIARQHGNEPAGTTASLALIEHFAQAPSTLEQAVLRRLEIIAVPVANPDGMVANQRKNAARMDLNRDWERCSQPETQALQAALRAHRPHAVMDLHELPARTKRASYQDNFVETIGVSADLPAALYAYAAAITRNISVWMSRYGYGLNVFYDHPGDSLELCHRYLGLYQGFPSFLCESKQGGNRPLAYRAGFHILAALVTANYLIHNPLAPAPATPDQVQVAQQPTPPPLPTVSPPESHPVDPVPVTLTVQAEPTVDDDGNRLVHIITEVTGDAEFAFVTIEVGAAIKVLTNQRHYRYVLPMSELEATDGPIVARVYDASDQVLDSEQLTLTGPSSAEALGP